MDVLPRILSFGRSQTQPKASLVVVFDKLPRVVGK